ncbi:MAG: hypothetical protein WCJ72_11635 [Chryseobacterium sp.]
MAKKIYQFDRSMLNLVLKPEHEAIVDGKKVMYRLVKGDSELDIKKQREKAETIPFRINSSLMVVTDETIQKWLESKPYFGTKINIYDPVKENENSMQSVIDNVKTVIKVTELSNEGLLGLGYQVLGQRALDMVKENNDYNGLKLQLSAKANQDAKYIETLLDSEKNSTYSWFALAFAKGIIKENESGTLVSWGGENGTEIISVPLGKKPIEAMVEHSSTVEGATVKQLIGQKMVDTVTKKVAENNSAKKDDSSKTNAGKEGSGKADDSKNAQVTK